MLPSYIYSSASPSDFYRGSRPKENELSTLEGTIHAIIYTNEDNGYAVIRVANTDGILVTAVGYLPFPGPGETLIAKGKWVSHASHGEQFSIEKADRALPEDSDAILEYLSSGIIRGIGKATAKLIVEKFGDKTLEILEKEPIKISCIKGISPKKAKLIADGYSRQTGLRRLMVLLASYDIGPEAAVRLMQEYGSDATKAVLNNPYILTDVHYAIPFEKADDMALSEGFECDDPRRCQAAVIYQLEFNLDQGHAYIPRDKLATSASQLLNNEELEHIETAISSLISDGRIVEEKGNDYLDFVYKAETETALFIRKRTLRPAEGQAKKLVSLVEEVEKNFEMVYAPAQRQAVLLAARSSLMLLTGGPGTGKTTTVRAMLRLFELQKLSVLLAAPTGRAAKRMSELTGREAKTIHRLLEFGPDPNTGVLRFLRDENRKLEADVVVIDETSMMDLLLTYQLIRALKEHTKLIFVGDPDQLPAIGPGNVLEDMIKSSAVDTVHLTEIFRQAQDSGIIMGAHSVNRGEVPSLSNNAKDFFFMQRSSVEMAAATIAELCGKRLPNNLGLDVSQIQVLTPTRKGTCGTIELNKALQDAVNPPSASKLEKRYGNYIYREGDRVMQIRNNYNLVRYDINTPIEVQLNDEAPENLGVFNGEIGSITEIDIRNECLKVRFDDCVVEYHFEMLGELEPAYAMTVHKSQGSEYDAVVLAMMPGPDPLMTRRVLYTAMTRAKSWLIVVGDSGVFRSMVQNVRNRKRYSALKDRIISGEKS